MVVSLPQRRSPRRRGRRFALRLDVEALETRSLPSATTWPGLLNPVAETEPNDTLDQAQNLGDLSTAPRAEVIGTISNGPAGAGVDWYSFQLDRAANVSLSTPQARASSQPVTTLSLYNNDPNDPNDPYDPLGYRLLAQADSAAQGGGARIQQRLAPGTYYVAVSGSGNHYFNPFLAGSGYAGATGDYGLLLTAADLGLTPTNGPAVLAADPQPGASLDRSPFLIRVDVSGPLDPNTVSAGGTVQLFGNATGTFGDGTDQAVPLAGASLNTAANELLLAPAAPLAPGYYKVVLAGNSGANAQVLADPSGIALGTTSSRPVGADFAYTFQVGGNEGNTKGGGTADDTPATSHQLGDLTQTGFVQIAGAVGDDSTDPIPFNGSDVDLYHFRVSGSGRYAFAAEVFAGRIGSPLSPGVSLFQVNPTTRQLSLLGSNGGTLNNAVATNATRPLYSDPALYAGLRAGDYYLAVSDHFNVPDPESSPPGTNGVFDPNVSHSGQNGSSTGNYVLNLQVQPVPDPPQVLAVSLKEGATLSGPPTRLTVQFSEPVNVQQLAFPAYGGGTGGTLAAVYVQRSDGTKYYPRFDSYDGKTNQATFLMLDGLGNDAYQLHLSGPLGLADLAGNALAGNDPSGDYVVHFKVNGPARGTGNNPLLWSDQEPNDDLGHPQDLGVLFRHELQTGVTLKRDFTQNPANAPADTADYYRFQVLESANYFFNFSSASLPAGALGALFDASGTPVSVARQPRSLGFSAYALPPGSYVVRIGAWSISQAARAKYTFVINLGSNPDNPVPLTVGPAPAISIRLVSDAPATPPPSPVIVSPPPASAPAVTSTTPTSAGPAPAPPAATTRPTTPPSSPPANTPPAPAVVATGPTTSPAAPAVTTTPAPTTVTTAPATPVAATNASPTTGITLATTGSVTPVGTTAPVATPSPAPATVPGPSPTAPELPAVAVAPATAPVSPAPPSAPVPSSGSVALLVTLVAPSGGNNTGLSAAVLRGTPDRPPESVNLPSGVLLALGAAPVGGLKDAALTDPPSPTGRVLVRLPDLSSPKQQLGAVAIPRIESGTSAIDASPPAAALPEVETTGPWSVNSLQRAQATSPSASAQNPGKLTTLIPQGVHQLMNTSYERALDAVFGMARWLEETGIQPPKPDSLPQDVSTQDESRDRGQTLLLGTVQVPSPLNQVLVNALAALGVIAVAVREWESARVREWQSARVGEQCPTLTLPLSHSPTLPPGEGGRV